ncbi:hypothetical protein D9M68_928620 [compost metagenome]
MAATVGVLRTGSTLLSCRLKGRLLSRAMANIMRMAAAWTARVQTTTATTMQARKALPKGPPRTESTMCCRPPSAAPTLGSVRSGAARMPKSRMSPPSTNEAVTARRIALGAVRLGSLVSSPRELAVSKPYMT